MAVNRAPILLLPGHMCDERAWRPVADRLEAAGPTVSHAHYGHDATIDGIADSVLANAPDRFVAVGFSMGAIVALALHRRAPERIAGLCLVAINPGPDRSTVRRLHQDRVRRGELAALTRDEVVPSYVAAGGARRDDLGALCVDMALTIGDDAFVAQSEALRTRADARPGLAAIRCPTLVIGGGGDRLCPLALHREVADAIPGAALELIDHAGHLVPLEQPAGVADAIIGWLGRNGLARAA